MLMLQIIFINEKPFESGGDHHIEEIMNKGD